MSALSRAVDLGCGGLPPAMFSSGSFAGYFELTQSQRAAAQ
ncbi:MAG: hypothetical protein U0872_01920 [Planctomycetaceae bacterium]